MIQGSQIEYQRFLGITKVPMSSTLFYSMLNSKVVAASDHSLILKSFNISKTMIKRVCSTLDKVLRTISSLNELMYQKQPATT